MSTVATDRRTALYRLYDSNGVLLYVGITYEPRVRFADHRQTKHWWPQVARRDITWYDTRAEADIAEAVAIRAEMPTENKALPDEDNIFRRGVGCAKFAPDEDLEQKISALVEMHKRLAEIDAAYRAKLVKLAKPTGGPVPVAHLAERLDVERKTVYRHLGKSMT